MRSESEKAFSLKSAVAVTLFVALMRLVASPLAGLPGNVSPMNSSALMAGALVGGVWASLAIPMALLFVTDLVVNVVLYGMASPFYQGFYWQYIAYALIVVLGRMTLGGAARRSELSLSRTLYSAAAGSVVFFLVTNFGVWASSGIYPSTSAGLVACFAAGLPFFKGTLAADLAFSGALFGLFASSRSGLLSRRLNAGAFARV